MLVQRTLKTVSSRGVVTAVRANSSSEPLYLNPHKWEGLPADRVFELHNLRQEALGEAYMPNNAERTAILATFSSLATNKTSLGYAYEKDNFKTRVMNNVALMNHGAPKYANVEVINKGATPHELRKIGQIERISAYEMPLLAKYRQEYVPAEDTKSPIKLTFNSDFSDETGSAFNRKVTLTVQLAHLKLDDKQAKKFKILSGNKFDHNKDVFRLSSEKFQEATQNARWLVETFNRLLTESKDLSKDSFDDVPLDTRHSKPYARKPAYEFPEEWKRPQDAPTQKHRIIRTLVDSVKEKKDQAYISKLSP